MSPVSRIGLSFAVLNFSRVCCFWSSVLPYRVNYAPLHLANDQFSSSSLPSSINDATRRSASELSKIAAGALPFLVNGYAYSANAREDPVTGKLIPNPEVPSSPSIRDGDDDIKLDMGLGSDAYSDLDGMRCCKLLNGMWQVSGAHGYQPERSAVVADMAKCANSGYTTFDLADIYGPAEEFVGSFRKGKDASSLSKDCRFFTKWVPRPQEITKAFTTAAIDKSLRRMETDRLDLVQFHWWDYENPYYYDAMNYLMDLQQNGKIRSIGLCNFDTEHMVKLMDQDAPIVSNQVAFSLIDDRPLEKMIPECQKRGVKLLVYGTLLGGFLSSSWLDKSEPDPGVLTNVSLRKYLPWINYWGGWGLFQELLRVLNTVANKHKVSISNVALRWVIDQPAVAGAIVGVRFGFKEHLSDNRQVFSFRLDGDDLAAINAVRSKSKPLYQVFGDCGGEYHSPRGRH